MRQPKLRPKGVGKTPGIRWPPVTYDLGDPQAAIPARIAEVDLGRLGATAARLERAANEIVRFDTEAALTGAPAAGLLTWVEGVSSARIARLYDSPERVCLAETGRGRWRLAARVAASVRATGLALAAATAELPAAQVAERLHECVSGVGVLGSRWRSGLVLEPPPPRAHTLHLAGVSHVKARLAEFVPPRPERVEAAMRDLASFMARDDLQTLAQAAVGHAQLLTIRPFTVGTGRTARALVQTALRAKGLTCGAAVPFSAVLRRRRREFQLALRAYRRGDARPLLELYAASAALAVALGRRVRGEVEDLVEDWDRRLGGTRLGSAARGLLPYMVEVPVFGALQAATALGVSKEAVYAACAQLAGLGIVRTVDPSARRDKLWCAPEALALRVRAVSQVEGDHGGFRSRPTAPRCRPAGRVPT